MPEAPTIDQTGLCTVAKHPGATVYTFASVEAAMEGARMMRKGEIRTMCDANAKYAKTREKDTNSHKGMIEWCEGMTAAECLDAVTNPPKGRKEAVDAVPSALQGERIRRAPRRQRLRGLDMGDELNAVAMIDRGLDRAWERRTRLPVRRPSIRVMLNGVASGGTPAQQFAYAAAAALSLVKAAEDAGYAIEVWFGMAVQESGHIAAVAVMLKGIDRALDWSTLVGVCVGPTFMRTVGFDLFNATLTTGHGNGYGMPSQWNPAWGEFDFISPATYRTPELAQKWAREAGASIGKGA